MSKKLTTAQVSEALDLIEATTVNYMGKKRGLSEQNMRALITSDAEVRASYERKNARGALALKAIKL